MFFKEFNHFFRDVVPDDSSSGTSDFNETSNISEPDDCYCESATNRSNTVYTKDKDIKKINDFPFKKVYFGSPNKMPSTMKLDGPLFVTPYIGLASIFAVRPQDLRKYGVTREIRVNRDYDEWKLPLTQLKEPFSTIHVVLQGLDKPFTMKPVVENATGYIYEIEVTPEIKDHIYQSSKMDKEKEFCIDGIDSIDFSNMKKIDVKVCIRGDNDTVQESSIFDDDDDDTEFDFLTPKLDNEIVFWLKKCYEFWNTVPDDVYKSDKLSVDISDIVPDTWELSTTTPDLWKDLIDETIHCSKAILYTIDEFNKLSVSQKSKHEGVKFNHDELIENITGILQLADKMKSLKLFEISDNQHIMTDEEKKQVNDIYELGYLFRTIAKSWVSEYKPILLRYFNEAEVKQEAFDAITGKEIPIDHAYTMDEMKERTFTDDDLDKIRSKEELNAFYTELKSKLGQDETIQESKMPAKKRNSLDNKDFGLVYKDANGKTIRKYPLNDKAHVASAARLFGHCPDKYKKRLANKILRKAHEFGMDTSGWDTVNKAAKQ